MLTRTRKILLASAITMLAQQAWAQTEATQQPAALPLDAASATMPSNQGIDWKTDKLSMYADIQHYNWRSDAGTSGRQTLMPLTATYRFGKAEFGLRTAYIDSVNTTPGRAGQVSTMSDTALSVAYTQQLQRGLGVRYNLDYNAPTGKATLTGAEKNAIMDGNLVSQIRFGEGHNVTPGIVVTKALNPNTAIGIGISHTVRGEYDPNGDVENDRLNPGNETRLTFQGQYAKENMMLIGGLIYTKSGTTQVNGQNYFRKGDRADLNLTGIFALPLDQSITAGLRYGTQRPDTYISSITGNFDKESRNINGDNTYISLEYAKKWQGQHTFKIMADWMENTANSYDQFNDLYNAGRQKYSLGIGYDYQVNRKSRISVSLRDFEMKDKATPATLVDTKYLGYIASIGINLAF